MIICSMIDDYGTDVEREILWCEYREGLYGKTGFVFFPSLPLVLMQMRG